MKEIVEAAIAAAAQRGIPVVIVGGERSASSYPTSGGGFVAAPPPAADADLVARFTAASQRIAAMEQAAAAREEANRALASERDSYSATLRNQEAEIRQLKALAQNPSAPPPPSGPVEQPINASYLGLDIAMLGLDEKQVKSFAKRGWGTVGTLLAAFREGKLTTEAKLPKDAVIKVCELLLNKAPSATAAPAAAPASSAPGASDVPTGHRDRPWADRLDSTRRKEKQKKELEAKIAASMAEAATKAAGSPERAALDASIATDEKVLGVLNGQMLALQWSCGLEHDPKKVKSVDDALRQAGLVHLLKTPPEASPAPPAPAETPVGTTA